MAERLFGAFVAGFFGFLIIGGLLIGLSLAQEYFFGSKENKEGNNSDKQSVTMPKNEQQTYRVD